ncbi:MAG: S8 family serine peptidase, partial [Candidatus Desantisbacteria bacterium]
MSSQRTKATSGATPGPDIEDLAGRNYYTYAYDNENKLLKIDIVRSQRRSVPPTSQRKAANSKSDELLVKFKSGTDEETIRNINTRLGTSIVKKIPKIDVYRLKILTGVSATQMVEEYKKEPQVEFAEPNYLVYALLTPNDPDFSKQWGLNNTGQTGGTPDSDIDAPEAWDIVTGDPAIVIAVIDTGVDYDHPDLKGRVMAGYDFVNNDEDPQDDHGHGTFLAGIASAITDNNVGISGTSWYSQIMPVKVLNSSGSGTDADVADGVVYASDNGAKVINLSLGSSSHSLTLQNAMRYAYEKGVNSVSAAGNDGGPVLYPAAYDEYTIGVAATDHNDQRASFSNYGPEVDVASPGVNIYSTWWNDT